MEILFGIQHTELLLFLKQLGLAVVGACAMWGFILSIRDLKHHDSKSWIIDDWLSMKLFNLLLVGVALASVSHYMLIPVIKALAHDGISVSPTAPEMLATFPIMSVLYFVLLALTFVMLVIRAKSEKLFSDLLTPFYATVFLLAFVMSSYSGWRGEVDSVQIFYFLHGFHSIFTLGSVIVLDYLFILSSHSDVLKQHIYKLFPAISKFIWVGLGLNFMSGLFILEHFEVTEKFLFVQTVVAILVINGVLLSGPIARKMTASVMGSASHISARWRMMGNIAGALSITSWITISSVDFFDTLTLGYRGLALGYFTLFALAFVGHLVFEKIEKNKLPQGV
jgi:hypothetical protein